MEHFIKTKTFTKPEQIHECASMRVKGKKKTEKGRNRTKERSGAVRDRKRERSKRKE